MEGCCAKMISLFSRMSRIQDVEAATSPSSRKT